MTEDDIKNYWYYFQSLTRQLQNTEQYVDHYLGANGEIINASTFSNEFAKILMLASAEFEVVSKALCTESGVSLPWNANIIRITKEILKIYPLIGDTTISTPYQTFQPLHNWTIVNATKRSGETVSKVEGIQWWNDHNDIKHNRRLHFYLANLSNCIDSLGSLMVLEYYLSQKVIGNVDAISKIGCSYFSAHYGMAALALNIGNELPDFK